MKSLKVTKILIVFAILSVLLSSFASIPAFASGDDGISTAAYETYYSQAFIGEYRTGVFYMDGNYMAFEITCIADDNQDHRVYVDLYRTSTDSTVTYPVHSDGYKRKYDGIKLYGGASSSFTLRCNENVKISFNLVFYSWH